MKFQFLILLLFTCLSKHYISENSLFPHSFLAHNPEEIEEVSQHSDIEKTIHIESDEKDPMEYLKQKEELAKLYVKHRQPKDKTFPKSMRFSEQNSNTGVDNIFNYQKKVTEIDKKLFSSDPSTVGTIANPRKKEYNSNEECAKIINAFSESNFVKRKEGETIEYSGKRIFEDTTEGGIKFWCSEGNHQMESIVNFYVEFERSYRLYSMWVYWAFAPGMFRVMYSNSQTEGTRVPWEEVVPWTNTVKQGTIIWWKSIISNPKTRWSYRSFDDRINFKESVMAKYMRISMKFPVNQYFGIYKLEFYTQANSLVMIQSKLQGENLCLSIINSKPSSRTGPLIVLDCLQAISFGDNRELFNVKSSGQIVAFSDGKCLQSPTPEVVSMADCTMSGDFKDERHKWILEYDGKIRSSKERHTCLTVSDLNGSDEIPHEEIKLTASCSQLDGVHEPSRVFEEDMHSYWASELTKSDVIFELYFHKSPYIVKTVKIEWKFPAKSFQVAAMFPDGFWHVFFKTTDNRKNVTSVYMLSRDIVGIKIIMKESTTKINNYYVYGIRCIHIYTGARFAMRAPCDGDYANGNKFNLIDVTVSDKIPGEEFKMALANIHKSKTQMRIVRRLTDKAPKVILKMKEASIVSNEKLNGISTLLTDFGTKISRFDTYLKDESLKKSTIGTSHLFPALGCWAIIKAFPSKRSGIYWIQNECMATPRRVYCDFDSYFRKGGLDYYIFNGDQPVNTPFKKTFRTFQDIRAECYILGMEPIDIKNKQMLENIFNLLQIEGYDLKTNNLFPIAFDYACSYSQCTEVFKPLSEDGVNDISQIISDFIESKQVNHLFPEKDTTLFPLLIKNIAAFGKEDSIVYANLGSSKVGGVICSTNKALVEKKKNMIYVECETNLRSEQFLGYETFSTIKVKCPVDCSSRKNAKIFGTDVYTDNSSICKAAIHSGVITNKGGFVEVHLETGRQQYLGSNRFGIESMTFSDPWDRSFIVKKFAPHCPLEKLKVFLATEDPNKNEDEDEEKTFIEIDTKVNDSNIKHDEMKLLSEIQHKISDFKVALSQGDSILQQHPSLVAPKEDLAVKLNELTRFLESELTASKVGPEFVKTAMMSQPLPDKKLNVEQVHSLMKSELVKTLEQSQKEMLQKREEDKMKKFVGFTDNNPIGGARLKTEAGLNYMKSMYEKYSEYFDEVQKASHQLKTILGKEILEIEMLKEDKTMGINHQNERFSQLEDLSEKILGKIYEINQKVQNKLKNSQTKLIEATNKFNRFNHRNPFTEDFTEKDIFTKWRIYNSKKGIGLPPTWDYYQYNVGGHFKVIRQSGKFKDNHTGSHLILKSHDYYDFEMKFSFTLKDAGTFGIAFKYQDPYHYYIFEVSRKQKGYKRVRKFVNGIPNDIVEKFDGGCVEGIWYDVKIRAVQDRYQIFMNEHQEHATKIQYEPQFDFHDNRLVHGTIAFATNEIRLTMIDTFSIVPIACTQEDTSKGRSRIVTLSPTCSRFYETFVNGFRQRWNVFDPLETFDGPSIWEIKTQIEKRENVLLQKSLLRGTSDSQEGSLYILTDPRKVCMNGKFIIGVKPLDEKGILGVVFRFENNPVKQESSYYIFEISGDANEKFARIRKKLDKKFHLVSHAPNLMYRVNTWMKIMITMQQNSFNVFISQNGLQDDMYNVFPSVVVDNDLKFGNVGLSTFKTRAIYDEIMLSPFDNLDHKTANEEEFIYVDENELDLPKNKVKDMTIFDRINKSVSNFSWQKCLKYPVHEEKIKYCDILFTSENSIEKCKNDFCEACCKKLVDTTNKTHFFLCKKQCNLLNTGSYKNPSTKTCIEPQHQINSIYPYCEENFKDDIIEKQKCKVDMCQLCCVALDAHYTLVALNNLGLTSCYEKCFKTFNLKKYQNQNNIN